MDKTKSLLIVASVTSVVGAIAGTYVAIQSQPSPPTFTNSTPTPQVTQYPPSSPAAPETPQPANSESPTPQPVQSQVPASTAPQPAPTPPVVSPTTAPQPSTTPSPASPPVKPIVVTPPQDGCSIRAALVDDPNPPTNVRSSPEVAAGNIVGKLDNGTYISVLAEKDGWFQISEPAGWVSKKVTQSSCSNVRKPINFPANGTRAIVKGRIIGGGSHQYLLNAAKGQTMTVSKLSQEGVFPTIVDPNGKILAGDPYTDGNRSEWRGDLPLTGDYSLQMDSNFKGFEYEFSVEVK